MIDWLASPLSGATLHQVAPWAAWHARCMVLAWAVLLPLGVLAARYGKVMPRQAWPQVLDNPAWWHAHRGLQWAGVVVMGVGALLAWWHGGSTALPVAASVTASATPPTSLLVSPLASLHGWAGHALIAAACLQVAASFARGSKGGPTDRRLRSVDPLQPADSLRGDHYDMSPRRQRFERLHKALGWAALLAAVGVIMLGLWLVDAPRWMPLLLGLWWLALAALAGYLQRCGRCIDTYQAIWGPGLQHPGNRRPPIGWGVRRPLG